MKISKIILILLFSFYTVLIVNAQSKVKIPEELRGFWHYEGSTPGDYDGATVGADYVEFWYRLYYVDKVEKQGDDGYRVTLRHENGDIYEMVVTNFKDKQGDFWFTSWDEPKTCKWLDFPTYTEKIPVKDLPKPVFKEWTSGDEGEVVCSFDGSDSVFYNNRKWEIVWAGYYFEKEYRMLINSGDLYKMIYLNSIKDQSMNLVCNWQTEPLRPLASNSDIYKVLGNWAQQSSNDWQYGFYEDFAIYDGDFWDYKSLNVTNSVAEITITNGGKSKSISLHLKDKETGELTLDGKSMGTFFKCGKNMPAYTVANHDSFKDTRFAKIDTITIVGYLRNVPNSQPFDVGFQDPIKDKEVEFFADIDEFGRFTLKFPLLNTTQVFLDWGRMTKMDVVEPGETYFMFHDFLNGKHLVMGDNERFHNEFAAYEYYIPSREMSQEEYYKIRELELMDFLEHKKTELEKGYAHLDYYIAQNPHVSDKFKYFFKNFYRYEVAFDLMQRRFDLDRNAKEKFPEGFMEYVNNTLYINPVQPLTLIRSNLYFLRDYIGYHYEINNSASVSVSSLEALDYMEKDGLLELSQADHDVISNTQEYFALLSKLNSEKADSITIAEETKTYKEDFEKFNKIYMQDKVQEFLKNDWQKIVSDILDKKSTNAKLAAFDVIIEDPMLKDIFETREFYNRIDYRKTELQEELLEMFEERVKNQTLANIVIEYNNHYKKLEKQDIFYAESLKNTDHLKDAKDADSLFASLIEPYKGKVVYIDFWGTWCGPCKQQMKYVSDVKEALKGKDVVFMYFANRSPEKSWENMIKEHQLTGENVVHYRLPDSQQAMIERRFSINSFPTYILMDKDGNIVNMKAPRPEQKNDLVNAVTKLL